MAGRETSVCLISFQMSIELVLTARNRSMDLTMMELQNSLERDLDAWAKLFEDADPRFKFQGGKKPEGSHLWILEAMWEEV